MVSFGNTADDYARHRAGFPDSFFDTLTDRGILKPGIRALDLGTGTGTVARGMALRGAHVSGLDIADEMMAQARQLDLAASVDVDYQVAPAEATGQPDNHFDLVTAGQCWHWFDVSRTTTEIHRILKPGGQVVIAHFDWLPLPGNVVEATEALILKHNPKWHLGDKNGVHSRHISDLRKNGFQDVRSFSYDEPAIYSHDAWRGRIRASAGVAVALNDEAVAAFDLELKAVLDNDFPTEPLLIEHCVFVIEGRSVG
jgi:SAM-dependent methyltransferase